MIYKTFGVYDAKAQVYLFPANYRRKEEALRAFSLACNDSNSDFHKYAEDYALFELGEFDDEKGVYSSLQIPLLVITAVQASNLHKQHYASIALSVVDNVA